MNVWQDCFQLHLQCCVFFFFAFCIPGRCFGYSGKACLACMLLQNFSVKVLRILLFVQQNQMSEPECLWWNTVFVFQTGLLVTYKCWQHEATVVTELVRKVNLGPGLSPLWAPGDRCPSGCCLTGLLVSIKHHTTNSQRRGLTPSEYCNKTITEQRLLRHDQMLLHLFSCFPAVPVSRALFWTMQMMCRCHSF